MSPKRIVGIIALACLASALAIIMVSIVGNAGPDTGNGDPDVEISEPSTGRLNVDPGEDAEFTIKVTNRGSGTDNFYVNITWDYSKDWEVDPNWTEKSIGEITKDDYKTFIVTLTPNDQPYVDEGERLRVDVKVYTRYQGAEKNSDTVYPTATCNQIYKVKTDVEGDDKKNVETGETASFSINVTNQGNGEDTFQFSLDNSTPLESGWSISLPTPVTLDRDESKIVSVKLKAANKASSGEHWYNIIVKSAGDSTKYDGEQLTVNVLEDYDFIVTAQNGVNQKNVKPDETANFNVTFHNTGNDEDQYDLEVDKSNQPDGWSYTLNQDSTPTIQPDGYFNLTNFLSVTAPTDYEKAPANSYWLVSVNVTSRANNSVKRVVVFKTVVNQVYDIEVSANVSSKWVDEGGTVYYDFIITNNGNGEDTVTVEITGEKADWADLNTPSSVVLSRKGTSGNKAYANISVSVPEGTEESSTGYKVNLTVISEDGKEKSSSRVSVKVRQNYDIRAEVFGATLKYINEEESGTFRLRFTNKGNGEDTILITAGGDKPGWASLPGSVTTKPDESKDVTLTVTVPKDQEMGTYNISITGTSDEDPSPNPATATVTVTIKVNQSYEVSLSFPKNTQLADVNSTIVFDFKVTNDGTGKDKIILDTVGLPSGWTRKFSQREVWLNASESKDMTLKITIPDDTPRKDFYMNVTATSFGKSSVFAKSQISISVNQSYDFTLDKDPPTRYANPGETVQFKITINNEGTGEDRIDVDIEQKPDYWTVDDLAAVTIPKSTSVIRFINISIPDNATKADYVIKLKGRSLKDPNHMTYSIELTVSVRKFYNFSIAIVGTTKSIDPGYKVNFTFTIENKGNTADSYSFKEIGLLDQWEPSYTPSPIQIEAKQSKEVKLSIYIPLEETQRTENIQINVTSNGNKQLTKIFTITVIVNQTYDLDISAEPAVAQIKPENNAYVEYNITINNTGTGTDSFSLELTPAVPSGWSYSLAANTGDIEKDHSVTKVLKINVPDDYAPGYYYFNVTATSDRRSSVSKKTPILVKILEIYEFDLTIDEDIKGIYPGEYKIFEFKVKNTGTAKDKIYFERSAIPSGWEAPYPSFVEINVSEEKTIKLNVSVDKDQTAEDYKIWLNGTSDNEPTFNRSADITVHVKQRYEVQLSIAKDTIKARPDEIVSFEFQLTNTGTGTDDFSFVANAPDGWTVELPLRQNDIPVRGTKKLYVNVTIPDDEPPDIYLINLTARSEGSKEGDIYKVKTYLNLYVDLKQKFEVDITPDEKTIILYPGTSSYVNLTVKNKGTGPDIYDIYVTGDNRTEATITYPENESLYLKPDETGYINVSFSADPLEDKWIWKIVINAKSTKEDYEGDIIDSTNISVDIQPYYNVTYVIDALKKKARPGAETVGAVEYKISAKNKGTGQDTITMKILAGANSSWASWPSGTPSDIVHANSIGPEHILKVDVPAGTRKGIYGIKVEVKSSKDPTKKEIIPIKVDVQRYTKFDVVYVEPLTVKNEPGDMESFKVKIINKGNSIENFTLETKEGFTKPSEFESMSYYPEDAVVMLYPTILRPNEFKFIYLNITTDDEAYPGEYTVPLIVYSTTNLSDMGGDKSKVEKKYGNFTVDIQPRYSLTLTGTKSSYDADPGRTIDVNLQVKNTGTKEDVVTLSYNESNLPSGWKITNPDTIDPFLIQTYNVTWKVEIKDKEQKKTFFINFTATMENGTPGIKEDDISAIFMVKFNVQQLFDVEVPVYKNITLNPGTSKIINISIKNVGTGLDLFELTLEGKDKDKGELNIDQLELEANEKGYANIIVMAVDKETDPYWNFSLKVKSLKSFDEVGYDVIEYTYCNIDIQPYYEVTYTTEATTKKAWPTRTSSYDTIFDLSSINKGTGEDTIEMEIVPGNYSSWAEWVAGKPSDTLQPGETGPSHQLKVRVPAKTLKTTATREYHIEILVKSTKDENATDKIDLEVDVQRYTLFDVTFTAPKRVDNDPGETSTFSIKITNKGNSIENFTAELQSGYTKPDGIKEVYYYPEDAVILLAPEESSWIFVNVSSDPEASPDVCDVSLMVYSKDNFTDMKGWNGVARIYDNFTIDIQARHSIDLTAKKDTYRDIDPDANVNVVLQIENTGTAEDDFSFTYVTEDLPTGWTIENPDPITLQSGERQDVTWNLHVYDKEKVGKFFINFTAKAKNGTENPVDDIVDEQMITFNIRQLFDIEVTKEQLPNIKPGVPFIVNFTVKNTGTGEDQYTTSMKGDIEFASFLTPETFTLQSGEKFNISVKVEPPEEPEEDRWWINITTKSDLSLEAVNKEVKAISHLNITIKAYYKPNILGDTVVNADTHGTQTMYFTFFLTLKNDGSGSDTISMAIGKVESPITAYWDGAQPFGYTIEPGMVGPEYKLKCEIPARTHKASYNISIWVNSTNDPSKNKIHNLTLNINKYYEVEKSIIEETIEAWLNQTPPIRAEFKVNITNKGNAKMDLRLRYYSGLPSKWSSNPGTDGRLLQNMKPDETRQETIIITVDKDAKEQVYDNIIFRVYPEEEKTEYEEIELKVDVKEFHKVRLVHASATPRTVEPTDGKNKVGIAVDVYNDGNIYDDIILSVSSSFYNLTPDANKWDIDFYKEETMENKITSVEVNANSKKTVYLGIELPTSVDDRGYVDAGSYSIPIHGESKEEPSANSSAIIPLIIKKVSEINVEYVQGTKKANPGDTISFYVKVENYGNAKDTMTFDVIDENDWSLPISGIYKKEFEAGEKREIYVNLTVPTIQEDDDAEAGKYDITLRVKPSAGTKKEVKLPFEIKEDYGCKIDLIDKIKNETLPDEGTVITFKAKISNLGNSETNIVVPKITGASNLSSADFDKWDVFIETATQKGRKELSIPIKPTESSEVTIKIEIHEGGYINTYGMLIRAYPEGKSQYEAKPQKIWLTLIEPIYKLKWTDSSQNQLKTVEPEKGTEIEYTVYLENQGTEDDTVTIRVEPLGSDLKGWEVKIRPPGAGEEATQITGIKIGDGGIQTLTIVVRPDEKADRDVYDIEITAESEIDTTATDKLKIRTQVKRPDLEILARDIQLPEDVKEGDLAQIICVVYNRGDAKARDVEVTFYTDIDRSEEIDSKTVTIPKNNSATVTGDWDVDAGKYHITIVVDEKEEIVEVNEENNRATATTLDVRQDLEIETIEITERKEKGTKVTVVVTVWNNGSADVRNVQCILYEGSNLIGKATISSITAGSSDIAEIEWKIPDEKDKSSYNLKAEVPTTIGGIEDPTPGNNKLRQTFEVVEKKGITKNILPLVLGSVIVVLVVVIAIILARKPKAPLPPGKLPPKKPPVKGKPPKAKAKKPGKVHPPPKKPGEPAKKEEAKEEKKVGKTIKCPKCGSPIIVTSTKRPLKIECKKCGAKGTLKK